MNQMTKFESSISRLHIRISELKPRLRDIAIQLDQDLNETDGVTNVERMIGAVRRECSDVLVLLKSLFELVVSNKPKPDPNVIRQLQSLKRDYESSVNELEADMARLREKAGRLNGVGAASRSSPTEKSSKQDKTVAVNNGRGDQAVEAVLDREASIRPQYDLLILRLEKLQADHRQAVSAVEKLKREFAVKEDEYKGKLAALSREIDDSWQRQQLDDASTFIGSLLEKNRWLEEKLKKKPARPSTCAARRNGALCAGRELFEF